jgi:hypothetical protein
MFWIFEWNWTIKYQGLMGVEVSNILLKYNGHMGFNEHFSWIKNKYNPECVFNWFFLGGYSSSRVIRN